MNSAGTLFLGTPQGEIVRLEEDGSTTHYASVSTQRMVFGADGTLYAAAQRGDATQIVRITGADAVQPLGGAMGQVALAGWGVHLAAAPEGGLYVYEERSRTLYFTGFDGEYRVVADLSALSGGGPAMLAVAPDGRVFYIPHGPYVLYQIMPDGTPVEFAYGIFGDPWGMVASPDGQWLYVAELGAIDRIPIGQ